MPTAPAKAFRDHWRLHGRALERLAERLPASAADFRPWDGAARTTARLLNHIRGRGTRFARAIQAGSFVELPHRSAGRWPWRTPWGG